MRTAFVAAGGAFTGVITGLRIGAVARRRRRLARARAIARYQPSHVRIIRDGVA